MKDFLVALIFTGIAMMGYGQSPLLDSLKQHTAQNDHGFHITLPGWSLNLISMLVTDEDVQSVMPMLKKTKRLEYSHWDNACDMDCLYEGIRRELMDNEYEDLLSVRSGNNKINGMVKMKDDLLDKIVLFIQDDDNTFHSFELETELRAEDLKNLQMN